MNLSNRKTTLGRCDIYLLDQVMKGRYESTEKVLDAGCGTGRHIDFFHRLGVDIYGIDRNPEAIDHCKRMYPELKDRFCVGSLSDMPYEDDSFDHVISSAVFHFATSTEHFLAMFAEHIRVLKIGGSLFIRMTSLFGLDPATVTDEKEGTYFLPDGYRRFLISYPLIDMLCDRYQIQLVETIKTVNVRDLRAMSVLVFEKM